MNIKGELCGKNVIFYSTPAYGHVNPSIALIRELVRCGCNVTVWSTPQFRDAYSKTGAAFMEYRLAEEFDPGAGSRLPELSVLLLDFTISHLDEFLSHAKKSCPDLILHDTLALWGRAVSQLLGVKAAAVHSIITAEGIKSRSMRMYSKHFSRTVVRQMYLLPEVIKKRSALKKSCGISTDLMSVMMNKEALNIHTYPSVMHPDAGKMDSTFFLGSSAIIRHGEFQKAARDKNSRLIYVSLGTIFSKSNSFWDDIISAFGNTEYRVIIACGAQYDEICKKSIPENIQPERFADQSRIMKEAALFITAGGMNSICEAAANGVPCLLCPQQGEQAINAGMLESLGLGKILKSGRSISQSAREIIAEYEPDEAMMKIFSAVRLDELKDRLAEYLREE